MKKLVKALVLALVLAAPVAISAPDAQAQTTPGQATSTRPFTNHTDVKATKHNKTKKRVRRRHSRKATNRIAPTNQVPNR